jgi:hypothetical protein
MDQIDELLAGFNRLRVRYLLIGGQAMRLAGSDLLAAKRAANRPQDQADIQFLEELQKLGTLR